MYTYKRFSTVLMSSALLLLTAVGTVQAVEMKTGDSMMKKDDSALMKGDEMMKKDGSSMIKDEPMMKDDTMMVAAADVSLGSRGGDVITLQTFLESRGLLLIPAGVAKGYFGPLTQSALMKYQSSVDVPSTGYYGPITRGVMSQMMMKKDAVMKKDETSMMDKADTVMKMGVYEVYSPAKIARAETEDVVLFFKADWCPSCRAVDADIKANLAKIHSGINILEVNFDSSTELRKKYGVTYQHTFVQIDAQGNMLKKWSGSGTLTALMAEVQ